MKIALFIKRTTFHSGYGGMETQNKMLCEGLVERGFEVTVFSPKRDLDKDKLNSNGVKYIFVPSVYRTLFSKKYKDSWFNKSKEYFEKEHSRENFDLVISQSSAAVSVLMNKQKYNLPGISISHGSIISELQTRQKNAKSIKTKLTIIKDAIFSVYIFFGRQRDFIHSSDHVIAVSNYVKNALITETYAPEEKFTVIFNGVDTSKLVNSSDYNSADTKLSLLFVGRLEREKGCDVLLRMASDSEFEGLDLDVYGTGPMKSTLEEIANQNTKGCHIKVHGRVPHEEVLKAYSLDKIFVFPTNRIEGFPMVLVEAMLGGCSTVAYNLGGVADAVKNEQTGFLIEPGDYESFKEKIFSLINSPDLATKYGENAKIIAQREFSIEKMLSRYIKVIKKVKNS